MNLEQLQHIYFAGIGGIGMSALARYFVQRGCNVYGYDRVATPLTRQLETEGCLITYIDDAGTLPAAFMQPGTNNMVVYTPAVPLQLSIMQQVQSRGFTLYKRSQVLGIISAGSYCLAVAGTHGKTTTAAILAHILQHSGLGCTAFVGGIMANYGTNYLTSTNNILVAEADEFDRSFLQLKPAVAAINAIDADHLDIYGDTASFEQCFKEFAQLVPTGMLYNRAGLPFKGISYNAAGGADVTATRLTINSGVYSFTYTAPNITIPGINLAMPGMHNVNNALAAISLALRAGVGTKSIAPAIGSFKGISRRFQYVVNAQQAVVIDDYAHHPTELEALFNTLNELFPGVPVTAVFQPHLYSRTKDFAAGFAQQLSRAAKLYLLDIYAAREQPIEGVTSAALAGTINTDVTLVTKQQALKAIAATRPALLVTIGAGDIDTLPPLIKEVYNV